MADQSTVPRAGSPVLRLPRFNWKAIDKYKELSNLEIEIKIIFMTNNYNTQESEWIPIILNWLGWEVLIFMVTLYHEEQ